MGGKSVDMRNFKTQIPDLPNNVALIKGMFQDTLSKWRDIIAKESFISFINMDADVYSATRYALDCLNFNIVPGTIIRFDELSDWRVIGFEENYPETRNIAPDTRYTTWEQGEWRALGEWCAKYNRQYKPLWRNWHQSAGIIITL